MPVIGLPTRVLRSFLESELTTEKLAETIDRIGCDLEEVTVVTVFGCPSCGGPETRLPREDPPKLCGQCGHESAEAFPETGQEEMVRLDLLPARPDLFDAGGLTRAIRGYLGLKTGLPTYDVEPGNVVVTVDPSVKAVRPEIACAEIVGNAISEDDLVGIFRLQEDLHWAVGRDRKRASIGVYDMSTHGEAIHWTTKSPDFAFTPLGMPGEKMSLADVLENHPKGKAYAHLLEGFDRYPVLIDDDGQVLSMPPIINSEQTKLKSGATRLLIDVTGPDRRSVDDALALLVSAVAEHEVTIRSVTIEDGDETRVTPDLEPTVTRLDRARTTRLIGVEMTDGEMDDCLDRMRLGIGDRHDDGTIDVIVPRYRTDVRHEVDLVEDVAIAYGFHNLPSTLVPTMTVGVELPMTRLSCDVRAVMTGLSFYEAMTFVLTNEDEHSRRMRLPDDLGEVRLRNPISVTNTIMRSHMLGSLMATFARNRTREMPQRLFELGEVAHATEGSCEQSHRLCIGVMGPRADYATVRSTVDEICHETGVGVDERVVPGDDHELAPAFLPGRVAKVLVGDVELGVMGEVHPEVIVAFGLEHPVAMAQLDMDALLGLTKS
ncbi:MAG: phenylalanine--tRNA ligase subunit beta [Planctomycetota bacterium]